MMMKRSLLCALMLACSALPAGTASLVKTYSYFSIGGGTLDDIGSQLTKLGPRVKSTGMRHPGATQMAFTTRVSYAQKSNSCAIADADVTLKVKVILPEWRRPRKADAGVRLFWDTLSADIKRHEDRHVEIAKNHASALEAALKATHPRKTCQEAKAKAAEISAAILAKHDRAQMQFDRVETINFESRILRLLRYRMQRIENGRLPG
ncbi:Peptidase [Mesorhizobium ventifaucium]|uniref:Peptidase n=2 Tax=Mesorhizobium ventifaucium TaxID=666020 RepID=A0ABN8JVL9_9HYPH|nr:Peptidase [Mesorhizobium ventifaucium]